MFKTFPIGIYTLRDKKKCIYTLTAAKKKTTYTHDRVWFQSLNIQHVINNMFTAHVTMKSQLGLHVK